MVIGMRKVSKGTLVIRAAVAVYLLYLVYGLVQDYGTSQNKVMIGFAIIVFALCGGVILLMSLRDLAKGEYDDGGTAQEQHAEEDMQQIEENKEDAE